MNRIISTLLILLLFCINSFAQQIPNAGFETWSGGEPENWKTSNQDIPILGTVSTVTKDISDPQQGLASAKLTAIKVSIPFVGNYNIPGALTLGKLNIDLINQKASVSGGIPFTGKPLKISGYFKYQPVENDTCFFGMGLFKWNNGKRDTIGFAGMDTMGTFNSWTHFELPVHYLGQGEPDTMNILVLNSNPLDGVDHSGTKLWIDNLSFDYGTVGIEGVNSAKGLRIYAEPDTKQLILEAAFDNQKNLDISLFNMSGIETRQWKRSMHNSTERLDINNLSPGTYVIRITSGNRLIDSRKITILN
jgi:hypothetical protein